MPNAMRLKSRRFIFILCPSIENRHHAIALEMIRAPYQQLHLTYQVAPTVMLI